jgi:hypothetical protein
MGGVLCIFSKLFQIQHVSVQAFPKKALAVLWNFKGLQASKTTFDVSPNFLWVAPPFRRIPDTAALYSAVSRRVARSRTAVRGCLFCSGVADAFMAAR